MRNSTTESREEIIRYIDETNQKLWQLRGLPKYDLETISKDVLEKARQIDYKLGIGRCLMNKGMGAFIKYNNPTLAIQILNESIELFKEIDNKKWIANAHGTIGIIHNTIGNSEAALYNALRGLDYYTCNPEDFADRVMIYYVLGTIYKDLKKYTEAEAYYLNGIEYINKDHSNWGGRVFTGLANVYAALNKFDEALKYSFIALEILREQNNNIGESRALTDIGVIYKNQGQFNDALKYLQEGLAIRVKHDFKQFIISSYTEIAEVYWAMGKIQEAVQQLELGETMAIEIKQLPKLAKIYQLLSSIDKSTGDFKNSLFYSEKLVELNDSIYKAEIETRINNLQSSLVKEKEEEIERLKNVELKNAYGIITEKNKEITDSINYASRIQQGILPSAEDLTECFENYFVLFKPKDIVSGDFYWCKKVLMNNNEVDVSIIAAVDCTGHGVPGAFMSMLGQTLLNQSMKTGEVTSPADALNYLNQELPENLKSQNKLESIKDGMDIALIAIEWNSKKLLYAGANNPIWIVRKNELIELKPTKQAITASNLFEKKSFENKMYTLQTGDLIYLFTDGYADQFGGAKGKKFKYKNLQNILLQNGHLPMIQQEKLLDSEFEKWRGTNEQVDDVLVIGIRI